MFNTPRPNVIESTEGYSVQVLGRVGLRHIEKGKSIEIDSEVLAGDPAIGIYSNSICKWDDGSSIDDATRCRIIQNIKDAFKSQGANIDVI